MVRGLWPEISDLGCIIAVAQSGIMTPITGLATELLDGPASALDCQREAPRLLRLG